MEDEKKIYTFNQATKFIENNELEKFKEVDITNLKNHKEENLLMIACENNKLNFIKYIVENKLLDINSLNKDSLNCLYYIDYRNNNAIEILKFLIENNINVYTIQKRTNIFFHLRKKQILYKDIAAKAAASVHRNHATTSTADINFEIYFNILINSYVKYLINNINDTNFIDNSVYNICWLDDPVMDKIIIHFNEKLQYYIYLLNIYTDTFDKVIKICNDITCFNKYIISFSNLFERDILDINKRQRVSERQRISEREYFELTSESKKVFNALVTICKKKEYDNYNKDKYIKLINIINTYIKELIEHLKNNNDNIINKLTQIKLKVEAIREKQKQLEIIKKQLLEDEDNEKEKRKKETEKFLNKYSSRDLTSEIEIENDSDSDSDNKSKNIEETEIKITEIKPINDLLKDETIKMEDEIKNIRKNFFYEDNISLNDNNKGFTKSGFINPSKLFEYIIFNYIKDYLIYIITKINDNQKKFKLILYGGACVEYYSKGKYKTNDLDFKLIPNMGYKKIDSQIEFLKDNVLPYLSSLDVKEILKKEYVNLITKIDNIDKLNEWKNILDQRNLFFKYIYDTTRGIVKVSIVSNLNEVFNIIDINLYNDDIENEPILYTKELGIYYLLKKEKLIENYENLYKEYKEFSSTGERDLKFIKIVNNNTVKFIGEKAEKYLKILKDDDGKKYKHSLKRRSKKYKHSLKRRSKKYKHSLKRRSKKYKHSLK